MQVAVAAATLVEKPVAVTAREVMEAK